MAPGVGHCAGLDVDAIVSADDALGLVGHAACSEDENAGCPTADDPLVGDAAAGAEKNTVSMRRDGAGVGDLASAAVNENAIERTANRPAGLVGYAAAAAEINASPIPTRPRDATAVGHRASRMQVDTVVTTQHTLVGDDPLGAGIAIHRICEPGGDVGLGAKYDGVLGGGKGCRSWPECR
jgi:hypothetical protein